MRQVKYSKVTGNSAPRLNGSMCVSFRQLVLANPSNGSTTQYTGDQRAYMQLSMGGTMICVLPWEYRRVVPPLGVTGLRTFLRQIFDNRTPKQNCASLLVIVFLDFDWRYSAILKQVHCRHIYEPLMGVLTKSWWLP